MNTTTTTTPRRKPTQLDRVYRLLNGAMYPTTAPQIARALSMPLASVRRSLSELRALGITIDEPSRRTSGWYRIDHHATTHAARTTTEGGSK